MKTHFLFYGPSNPAYFAAEKTDLLLFLYLHARAFRDKKHATCDAKGETWRVTSGSLFSLAHPRRLLPARYRLFLPPPLFFRINAVGTIPFQLSLRINPLFDVSRLLAIKRANGTRWRVAPCDGCECDGRRRLHKQQDGRRRPPRSAGGCAATPAWPADERVVLRKERTPPRVPCQFFPNVWPFEILARAALQSQPLLLPLGPQFYPPLAILRIPQLLKTTRISNLNIFESRITPRNGTTH